MRFAGGLYRIFLWSSPAVYDILKKDLMDMAIWFKPADGIADSPALIF